MLKFLPVLFFLIFPFYLKAQLWTNPATGLPSSNVTSIAIDSEDKIWISTLSGIAAFENNLWKTYGLNNSSGGEEILNVWATGQSIWVGTEYRGLWEFDGSSNWKNYHPNSSGNGIVGFGQDSKGTVWILDKFGSFDKWTGSSWEEINWYISQGTNLFVDKEDNVWVLSNNTGLLKYKDGVTTKWSSSWYDKTRPDYIPNGSLHDMVQDADGMYWIASDGGIMKFDGTNFQVFDTSNSAISSNKTRCLAIDHDGALWIGTRDAGIIRYDGTTWTTYNTVNSPLHSNIINSIAVDGDNKIWVANGYNHLISGGQGKGVFVLDQDRDISQGRTPAAPTALQSKTISEQEVVLSWKDNADNEAGFQLERSTGDADHFELVKFLQADATSFVDLTVTGASMYYYRIRTTNSMGESVYSNTVVVQPKYCTVNKASYGAYAIATKVHFGQIQNEPFNCLNGYYDYLDKSTTLFSGKTVLFTVAFDRCQITTDEIIGGEVYIDWNSDGDFTDAGEQIFQDLAITAKGEYSFPVTVPASVVPGTTTRLRIRANDDTYNGIGSCGYAEETQDYTLAIEEAVALGKPASVTAQVLSASSILVTWEDNASTETVYVVERSTDGTSFSKLTELSSNTVQYTDESLQAGTTYHYRIYAKAGNSSSEKSAVATETTLPVDFFRVKEGQIASEQSYGDGIFWGDYNNDGHQDLFTAGDNVLYSNQNSLLNKSNITFRTNGAGAWADYDNDGDLDFFAIGQSYGNSTSTLYENMGNGAFSETYIAGVTGTIGSCSWLDYDRDGYLDLFLTFPYMREGILYRNNGDKSFSVETKLKEAGGNVTSVDYDNDGDEDLFFTSSVKNVLYENRGGGNFVLNQKSILTTTYSGGNGSSWADFDNDGDLDVFLANGIYEPEANMLFINHGNGFFLPSSDPVFEQDEGQSHGSAWADYDNDGFLDLFVANVQGRNMLYHNNGNGTFTKITQGEIVNETDEYAYNGPSSFGCAWADYNNDGFLDLAVAKRSGTRNSFYKNSGNSNHWINLLLIGTVSNRSAIGTKVQVKSNGRWQYHHVFSQTGYNGQNSLNVEFGLGTANSIDSLVIMWPSGSKQVRTSVSVDKFLSIEEPVSYSLSGTVTAEDGRQVIKGKVLLYVRSGSGSFTLLEKKELKDSNTFAFRCLPGIYKVQAVPDTTTYPDVAQGYWRNSLSLASAATLEIANEDKAEIAINLAVVEAEEGQGTIEGELVEGEDLEGGRIYQGTLAAGTAIAGVPVYLVNVASQKVSRQAFTNETGRFTFTNLQNGEYYFVADYQGLRMHTASSLLRVAGDVLQITAVAGQEEIKVDVAGITGVDDLLSSELSLYPNPFMDSFVLEVNNSWRGPVTIQIFNALGANINNVNLIKNHERQTAQVQLQHHAAGMYLVIVSFGNTNKRYKLVKAN
ncbi:FG-GAP-like repeat-containing protein [Pontibacter harenae]|uniref:FG-GAP-like repeat-containing protein n=1 Tax=Pontibacter harenae TaxID=2894083 RepID=UPI001E33455D|nr:FG-GAP-like repeat-containing protein [Pontibacter harenae]MCC9169014.1 FG-GAP-like repeat-containing protein [Pontibacter harenae]